MQPCPTPEVRLLDLTTHISAESCGLPGDFHSDPADQIIVATATHHRVGLVTLDERIRRYPHGQRVGVGNTENARTTSTRQGVPCQARPDAKCACPMITLRQF